MSTDTPTRKRIECYLRGDTYGTYDRQQAILETIRSLETAGVLAETSVEADWQRIRTPEQDCRDGAIETYREFRAWADQNGYSLEPAFEHRHRAYLGRDAIDEVVVFPIVSLAVYEDTDLRAVFPCTDGTGEIHFSVGGCLDALEDREADAWLEQFSTITVDRSEPHVATLAV